MAIRPSLGLSNLLVSRVMRHRNMATLFGTAAQPAGTRSPGEPSTYPDIVTAVPIAYVADEGWPVPAIASGEPRRLRTPEASAAALGPPRSAPTRATQRRLAHRQVATPEPEDAVPETSPTEDRVVGEAPSDTSITEDVWRRLKTIFQRHQDGPSESQSAGVTEADRGTVSRAAPEQTTQSTVPSAARVGPESVVPLGSSRPVDETRVKRVESPPGLPASQAQETSTGNAPALQQIEPRPAPSEPDTPVAHLEQGGPEASEMLEVQEIGAASEPPAPSEAAPATPQRTPSLKPQAPTAPITEATRPTEPEAAGPATALVPVEPTTISSGPTRSDQPLEAALPLGATETEPRLPVPGAGPEEGQPAQREADIAEFAAVPETPLSDATPRASLTPPEETSQPVPLESVWPVQRIAPAAPSLPVLPGGTVGPAEARRSAPAIREGSSVPASVAQVLERVAAGGPTQSGIEVLAPSRPRPTVLRHREQASEAREPHTDSDDTSTLIRVSAQTPESGASPTDDLIQTPIGSLPKDLWQLIGEPIPEQRTSRRQELEPSHDTASEPMSGAAIGARGRPASPPAPQLSQPPSRLPSAGRAPATAIQRSTVAQQAQAPTTSTVQSPAAEQQQAPTEATSEEESGAEVDIGELARRVYAEIKRRLTVERERFRSF